MGYKPENKSENSTEIFVKEDNLCILMLPFWAEEGATFNRCHALEFNHEPPTTQINKAHHIEPTLLQTMGNWLQRQSAPGTHSWTDFSNWPQRFPDGFKYLRHLFPEMESMRIMAFWLLMMPTAFLFLLGKLYSIHGNFFSPTRKRNLRLYCI